MEKRILIVEDEGSLSDALARRFKRRGFIVRECSDPASAVSLLRERNIDLVICDINLNAHLTGFDIFNTMKAEKLDVPFVFFTGHGEDTQEMQRALEEGADAVFAKPTDFSVLLEKVCVLLGISSDTVSLPPAK